jgi:DNA-binding NarL/FixJ family response regulator
MRISMPELSGYLHAGNWLARDPLNRKSKRARSTRVILFTASAEEDELVASAPAGAYAFIAKDAKPDLLVHALRQIANGQRVLPLSRSGKTATEKM